MIKDFFPNRDCICLIRPTEEETDLQELYTLKDDQIRKEFLEGVKNIRDVIDKNMCIKNINDRAITGPMLVSIAQS